ncbi:MAG: DUF748 domain-containing protein [Chromatiales bacterium]|nr:DUF748 domain-containing protein [Chromatiales bacterium]
MQKPPIPARALLKSGGAIAGLLALYAALGFLGVPRLVTGLARDTVKADYGRDLALGAVRFNPFTLTLELDQLALPDADGSPMLGFDRLLVDLDLNSIWRRALSFRAIRLEGLAVNAVVRRGGKLNFDDLAAPQEPGTPASTDDEPLPRLIIGELSVSEGRVRYEDRDRPEPFVADLRPLTFRLTDFSTYIAGGERYELDATVFDTGRFAWRGTLTARPLASEGEFTLSELPLARLAGFLGDALRLEITRGAASLRGRYRFADRPSGPDVVVEAGELVVTKLAIRDRGEATDYVDLDKVTATGLGLSLADEKAVVGEITFDGGSFQAWLTPEGELRRSGIFDPLVVESAPTEQSAPAPPSAPAEGGWEVKIPRINFRNLSLGLEDRGLVPAPTFILKPLNVTIEGYSTAPGTTVRAGLDAIVNGEGSVKAQASANLDTLATTAEVDVSGLNLALAQPYIAREASLTLTKGTLSAKGQVTYADVAPAGELGFTGDVTVSGLRTTDNVLREDFINWDVLRVEGVEYRSAPGNLRIRTIDARSPYARVIIGPDGTTNVAAVLAGPGATATAVPGPTVGPGESRTGEPVAVTKAPPAGPDRAGAAPFPIRIGTVKISNGSARFADLTTRPSFAIGIEKLQGTIAGLSSAAASRAKVELDGRVDRFSPVTIRGEVNPLAAETYLDMAMTFRNVELASFTPYSGRFAGYAIRQGKLSVDLNYKVNDRKLDADHKFVINQLELGDKVESPDAVGLPLKLAVALLKDRNGVIDLDLPVTGDLDDPEFRIGPIVWKVLVNLLTKAVTAPFALLGNLFGGGEEINLITFAGGDPALDAPDQEKVATLVKALNERPGLQLTVPAVFNRAADEPALREAGLQAKLVAARKAGLAARKQPVEEVTFASVSAEPEAYQKLLASVYRQEYGKDTPLPEPPPEATDPAARIRLLEDGLRERVAVTDTEYFALAKARADAVQAALLTGTGIDPGRVFLTAPAEGKADPAGVVMELALQ